MKTALLKQLKVLLLSTAMLVSAPLVFASTDLDETIATTGLSGSFLASRIAIRDNDDEAALKFLERAIELDPENANVKQDLFISLVTNGRVDEAAELARSSEVINQNNNLARIVSATEALRKRSWNNVTSALDGIKGSDLDAMLSEATASWALFGEGDVDAALERLGKLEGPDWIIVMRDYHSGLIAAAGGQNELAIEKFQNVLDQRSVISVLTETYIRAVEAQIRVYSKIEDPDSARQGFKYGISIIPNHPPFMNIDAALAEGKILNPLITSPQEGVSELFFNIATAIKRDGGSAFAKSYLQLADYLNPDSDVIDVALAELYLQEGKFEKSNLYYEQIAETSPFHRLSQLELANNLARLDKTEEAVASLKALIDENPKDLTGYLTLGRLYAHDMRYREAADVYDGAVNYLDGIKTNHWNLFFRRGIAYERLREWEKAEPNFNQALELAPNQPEVLNYLGYSWIDQGINLDKGMELIRKAVDLRPRAGFIVDSLGWAHYRLGQYEDAVRELEKAVTIMPQDPTINDHLGDAYWQVGRKLEATFQWKIALTGKPEIENPDEVKRKLREGL